MSRHTLSVLVEDKPGVLARVASLFSRRGFNIESLAVGPTEVPDVSRMTIVVNVESLPLEQVTKQLNKLINVLKIVELEPESSVQRAIVMVKVRNSTPEPDGSVKDYWLRVPPDMKTARSAVAWTFGMERNEYAPMMET